MKVPRQSGGSVCAMAVVHLVKAVAAHVTVLPLEKEIKSNDLWHASDAAKFQPKVECSYTKLGRRFTLSLLITLFPHFFP
jgi:hypothetical protein